MHEIREHDDSEQFSTIAKENSIQDWCDNDDDSDIRSTAVEQVDAEFEELCKNAEAEQYLKEDTQNDLWTDAYEYDNDIVWQIPDDSDPNPMRGAWSMLLYEDGKPDGEWGLFQLWFPDTGVSEDGSMMGGQGQSFEEAVWTVNLSVKGDNEVEVNVGEQLVCSGKFDGQSQTISGTVVRVTSDSDNEESESGEDGSDESDGEGGDNRSSADGDGDGEEEDREEEEEGEGEWEDAENGQEEEQVEDTPEVIWTFVMTRTPTHLHRFRPTTSELQANVAAARWRFAKDAIMYNLRRERCSATQLHERFLEHKRFYKLVNRAYLVECDASPVEDLNSDEQAELERLRCTLYPPDANFFMQYRPIHYLRVANFSYVLNSLFSALAYRYGTEATVAIPATRSLLEGNLHASPA